MTFPFRSHARNVSSFAHRYEPPYVTRRFGARMIWHERSPKQQPHPRVWLAQVQRPLSLIDERNLGLSALLALIHRSAWNRNSRKFDVKGVSIRQAWWRLPETACQLAVRR